MLNWFNEVWQSVINAIDSITNFFTNIWNLLETIINMFPSNLIIIITITITFIGIIAVYKLIRKG